MIPVIYTVVTVLVGSIRRFSRIEFLQFQAFLRRVCTSFNPFLSNLDNLDNSPHLTVFYSRFLLDPFTYYTVVTVLVGGSTGVHGRRVKHN